METLQGTVSGRGIATIRFNRPDKANSYDQAMLDRLGTLLEQYRDDETVRIVVLRGEGRHFSAGASIGEPFRSDATTERRQFIEVCTLLDEMPKPTIALVQGACIGGALALACCCDTIVAAPDAAFSIPEVRLGFAPGPLIPFFVRAMGQRAVRHYLLSGERFTGTEAHRIGLAQKLAEPGALDRALDDTTEALLLGAPGALARAKHVLQTDAVGQITPDTLRRLQAEFDRMSTSPEAVEGRASFKEKRKPGWYPA